MGTINYTITSGVVPIKVYLKIGSSVIMMNTHASLGTYSFTNVTNANYTIQFVDNQGCTRTENINICTTCAGGYTPVVGGCLYLDRKSATYSGPMYNLMGFTYSTYSTSGMLLFSNYNSDGTGTWQIKNSSYWTNPGNDLITSGPLNRSAVWTTSIVDNQDIAFQHCITIAVEKTYYVGIGCDNYGFIKLNGTTLITQSISALKAMLGSDDDRVPFLYWYIYPIVLKTGLNILEIGGHNNPGVVAAAVGVEIYDNTINDLINATSDASLNILFRSKNKVGTNCWYEYSPSGTHGYTCPSGYALDTCDGSPDCVKRYEYTCGGVPPILPTTTTTSTTRTPTTTTTTRTPTTTTTTRPPTTTTTTLILPTVSTTNKSSVTSSSAVSGGNVTNSGSLPVTSRGVCWSTSVTPTIANSKTVDGSGTGGFTSNITGLLETTDYYFRAYATSNVGTSYGTQYMLTTLCSRTVVGTLIFFTFNVEGNLITSSNVAYYTACLNANTCIGSSQAIGGYFLSGVVAQSYVYSNVSITNCQKIDHGVYVMKNGSVYYAVQLISGRLNYI